MVKSFHVHTLLWTLLSCLSLLLVAPSVEAGSIYERPISDVMWAIGKSQPKMGEGLRRSYAKILLSEGKKRKFDSFTAVAMVHFETRWNSKLVGGLNNACYGLGQTCAHIFKVCRDNGYKSPECLKKMKPYLNGANALYALGRSITRWRKYCRRLTGRPALFHRWLFGYQGNAYRDKSKQCGMRRTKRGWVNIPKTKLVMKVINYRLRLIRLNKRRKRR